MEKDLHKFLIKTGLDELDIKFMCSSFPELEETNAEEAIYNVKLVVDYGYPTDKLNFLLLLNPYIMLRDADELEDDLDKIEGDIYEALKNNPLLI